MKEKVRHPKRVVVIHPEGTRSEVDSGLSIMAAVELLDRTNAARQPDGTYLFPDGRRAVIEDDT